VCGNCFKPLDYLGQEHTNCTRVARNERLAKKISPISQAILATTYIKGHLEDGASSLKMACKHGPKLNVSIGAGAGPSNSEPTGFLGVDVMKIIKMQSKMSMNKVKDVVQVLTKFNIVKAESYLKAGLSRAAHELDQFFEKKKVAVDVRAPEIEEQGKRTLVPETKEGIFCTNIQGLIEHVKQHRKVLQPQIKFGADDGKKFLKIVMSVQDPERSNAKKDFFKDTSARKNFIVAIMEGVPENYPNMEAIMKQFKFEKWPCFWSSDLKMTNILLGLQSHSAKYPCSWCHGTSPWEEEAELRTIGSIMENYDDYCRVGKKNPRNAKNHKSVIHLPLIDGEPSDVILDIVMIGELHVYIGTASKVLDCTESAIKAYHEQHQVQLFDLFGWLKSHNILEKKYQGGGLNGPMTRRLLHKSAEFYEALPDQLKIFGKIFMALNEVAKACFGEDLSEDFADKIKILEALWKEAGISITPKAHALFTHVPQFCLKYGHGLGRYSEQALETSHQEWDSHWANYKRPEGHPDYEEQFLRAVVSFNSFHQ